MKVAVLVVQQRIGKSHYIQQNYTLNDSIMNLHVNSSFVNLLDESDWEADPAVQEMLHQTSRRSSTASMSRYIIKLNY